MGREGCGGANGIGWQSYKGRGLDGNVVSMGINVCWLNIILDSYLIFSV